MSLTLHSLYVPSDSDVVLTAKQMQKKPPRVPRLRFGLLLWLAAGGGSANQRSMSAF